MPELPEVETVVNGLRPHLSGQVITSVKTSGLRLRHDVDLSSREDICGRKIIDVRRRAKYLIFELEGSDALLFHLGMSGSFRIESDAVPGRKHDHVTLGLQNGQSLRFNAPRRFGIAKLVHLETPGIDPDELSSLGPEPLGKAFTPDYLAQCCRHRTKPIKNLIMDNHIVVGVGNIYASEALFRAGLRPTLPAGTIRRSRLNRLFQAIRNVLADAIHAGGSTIHTFEQVDGSEGQFQRHLDVYGRAGERCKSCNRGVVRQLPMAGRSTYFCPVCQR